LPNGLKNFPFTIVRSIILLQVLYGLDVLGWPRLHWLVFITLHYFYLSNFPGSCFWSINCMFFLVVYSGKLFLSDPD